MGKISSIILLIVACFEFVTLSQITCLTNSPQVSSAFFHSELLLKTMNNKTAHFVLVHGTGHGAWCWYKLTALLETAGHNVTSVDLAGCGISPKQLKDVVSIQDYVEPLMKVMDSIPNGEKVVLVGHSFGGLAMALPMEAFAEKISVAVFLAAVLVPPNSTLHQFFSMPSRGASGCMYDTKFSYDDGPEHGPTSVINGPKMLARRLYQQSPFEVGGFRQINLDPSPVPPESEPEALHRPKTRKDPAHLLYAGIEHQQLAPSVGNEVQAHEIHQKAGLILPPKIKNPIS